MLYFVLIGVFATCLLFVMGTLGQISKELMTIRQRLSSISTPTQDKHRFFLFRDEFAGRLIKIMSYFIRKLPFAVFFNKMDEKLKRAGYPFGRGIWGYLILKFLFTILVPVSFIFILAGTKYNSGVRAVLFLLFTVICILVPKEIYRYKLAARKRRLLEQVPYALDLLTVSVEAGSGFDGALLRVTEKVKGDLSKEFATALHEIQLGQSRRTALLNMAQRCDVPEISMLISSINHAEQMGISMGSILRIQASQMREKRRQYARENAIKAPVKILFPLVLLIFPAIFVVVLAPSLIKVLNLLSGR